MNGEATSNACAQQAQSLFYEASEPRGCKKLRWHRSGKRAWKRCTRQQHATRWASEVSARTEQSP